MRRGRLVVSGCVLVAAVMLAVLPAMASAPKVTVITNVSGVVNTNSATFALVINRQVRAIRALTCALDGVPVACYPLSPVDRQTSISGANFWPLATGPHTLTVTAALTDGGHATAAWAWEVSPVLLVGIEVSPRVAQIAPGASLQFAATATYSDGSVADLTHQVVWQSSDVNIASIDPSGLAHGGSQQGIAVIVASRWDFTSAPGILIVISP